MPIVAETYAFVVGVDTHAVNNVFTIITNTGAVIAQDSFANTIPATKRALAWIGRRTEGDATTLIVVEGVASYGALLAASATGAGYVVAEAARMDSKRFAAQGKSDLMDSHRIASSVLALSVDRLRMPRLDEGARASARVLLAARDSMNKERTSHINALTALVRTAVVLGVEARRPLNAAQIKEIASWRRRKNEEQATVTARNEAMRLAKRILVLDEEIAQNHTDLEEAVSIAGFGDVLGEYGVGVWVAAQLLAAYSHHGRITTEAQFAALAGVNPIPASSGNKNRYRLNRGGDRQLNRALHAVVLTRMAKDENTRTYVARRTKEGKSKREIMRCLKRFLARHLFRLLQRVTAPETPQTAS